MRSLLCSVACLAVAWTACADVVSHVSGTGEFRVTVPDFARGQVVAVQDGSKVRPFRREGDVFVLPAGPRRHFRYQTMP